MKKTTALFAGSFDPFTIGHASIVERALTMFDKVIIAIGFNEKKPGEWSVQQRLDAISGFWEGNPDVEVVAYSGLTVEFARKVEADVLLRGVRSVLDFEYERNLADINRTISGLETVLLYSLPQLSFISSSMVRELIHNGINPTKYIAGNFPVTTVK
ncbi:MAG: pantetheine-phosphate adenylyltransferase [Muribaculaceae bacterium]|nr:pantetheine-phosphate adenylyltransferase [Muribaculaceae bacterium]